jgi:hypothetical protein
MSFEHLRGVFYRVQMIALPSSTATGQIGELPGGT